MGAIKRGSLPADLERARSRFQAWRGRRKLGTRIPQALWALPARLAKVHGVGRTATVLCLSSTAADIAKLFALVFVVLFVVALVVGRSVIGGPTV